MSASSTNALSANRAVSPSLPSRGLPPPWGESRPALADPVRDGAPSIESLPGQETLRRLQHVRGHPAVSLLMSTIPADRLTPADAETMRRLTAEAEHRLWAEAGAPVAAALAARLRLLGDQAATSEATQGLGLFVHAHHAEIARLPTGVRDRVVVADTFATGDLVVALRHAPRYLLLLFAHHSTRLYDGSGRRLEERTAHAFPVMNPRRDIIDRLPVGYDVGASVARSARHRAYVRRVDTTLDHGAVQAALPIVLAGERPLTAAFLAVTAQPERVVGTVPGRDPHAGLDVLGRLADRVMRSHTARKEREVVAALPDAHADGRVVTGIADAWPAVLEGQRGTLLVEEPCTYPARLTGDGLSLRPAPPEGGRGVVANAIGELAWAVKFYGGDIIVVPKGTLADFEGIALVLDGEPTPTS